MKKLEHFWNVVYYGIYTFDVYLTNLLDYLNPFALINRINRVRKFHSAHGIENMNKFRNRVLNNPRTGTSIAISSGIIGGLLVLIEYGFFNIIQRITGNDLIEKLLEDSIFIYLIVLVVPVYLINHYLLFQKDKYLVYFKIFDKSDERKRRYYFFVSLISIVVIVSFFFLSFLSLQSY